MAELAGLFAKLDSDKLVRGRQFERICKWYFRNDPRYRLELKRVWLWNEWPDKWGPDAGIDLVAETFDKKLWAIQAKAYEETYSIKKADIDTFLSESSRPVFSYRLLIATTNFIGRTAERTLHDQEKPVGRVLLSDLQKSQVIWPESPEKLEAKVVQPKIPYPHQQKAIDDVCKGFRDNERGQLIMACGTGKTLVALWVAERLKSRRTLILLPSLSLLAQTLREWAANAGKTFHYLPVCSDDTVRGADRLVSRTSDLGLPVTTNADEVAAFLRRGERIVVLSTYQSSPVVAEAFKQSGVPSFDVAIADEAHRCAGRAEGQFATILDGDGIKARRRLFMTATPRYFTNKVKREAEQLDFEIASMDDASKFGQVFHLLSFSKAIEQDLLCDYQFVIVGVDDATYRRYAEEGTFVTTDGKEVTDARTLASQIALAKAVRKYDLKRVVTFHGRIKRAREFSDKFPDVVRWIPENSRPTGDVWSKHVSGEMPSSKRDSLLNRLRDLDAGERGVLANARCLAEGVDVPDLDGVAFIDPRRSELDIVQAVGRAIRKSPNKKIGTVVLPVFVNTEQDCEVALDSSLFRPIWDVLKALRAHDDLLAYNLDQLRRQLGRDLTAKVELPEKLFVDVPVTVGQAFAESFRVKAVEKSTASWEFWFGLLERYVEQEGHARVATGHTTLDGYNLGSWVHRQRFLYWRGELPKEKRQALKRLAGWYWSDSEASWKEGIKRLRKYAKSEGHCLVAHDYVTDDGFRLGNWVSIKRLAYRRGRLSPKQQASLEALPRWTWGHTMPDRKAKKTMWLTGLACLREYAGYHGHVTVPGSYVTEEGFNLGVWAMRQRIAYRKGELSLEQQGLLEELPGWILSTMGVKWVKGFKRLRAFVAREGHALVWWSHTTADGYKLGEWVAKQREAYGRRQLSTEQKEALENLPDWEWDTFEAWWRAGLKRLLKYVERKRTALVPLNYVTQDGCELGKWVARQREAFKDKKLPAYKQAALEKLPGWEWHPK